MFYTLTPIRQTCTVYLHNQEANMTAFKMKGRAIEVRPYDTLNGTGNLLAMIRIHPAVRDISAHFAINLVDGLTDWYEAEGLMWRIVDGDTEPTAWRNLEDGSEHCLECQGAGQKPNGDRCWHCDGIGWDAGPKPAKTKAQG